MGGKFVEKKREMVERKGPWKKTGRESSRSKEKKRTLARMVRR